MRGSLLQVGLNLLAAHASVGFDTQVFYLTIADAHVTLQPTSAAQFALVSRTSPQVSNHSIYPLGPTGFYDTPLATTKPILHRFYKSITGTYRDMSIL